MSLVLVGAGKMARAYYEVLHARGVEVSVIGRGEISAHEFEQKTGKHVERGGIEGWIDNQNSWTGDAIIAVDVDCSRECALAALKAGARRVLLEKPGAMDSAGLREIDLVAKRAGAQAWIAYNRRFYRSTEAVREIIREDGGVESCHIEFDEDGDKLVASSRSEAVLRATIHNHTCHILDLAWNLAGDPVEMASWHADHLPWHGSARFAGSGKTGKGALFTYRANWLRRGRWKLELLTAHRVVLFAPLERPTWRKLDASEFQPVESRSNDDELFKAGVSGLIDAFLDGKASEQLCSIEEQIGRTALYRKIGGYDL